MVVAIILGGNVQVLDGKTVGGSFAHIPECTSSHQTGCVIAYSSFSTTPPADALFARPGAGVSLQSGQTRSAGEHVACTNPAGLGNSSAEPLTPYFIRVTKSGSTTWVTLSGAVHRRLHVQGWGHLAADTAAPGDPRTVVQPALGPTWGLHEYDVNLALGNLIEDVSAAEAAYTTRHH